MRREFAAVLCAVALLLAGCQGLGTDSATPGPNATETPDGVVTPTVGDGTESSENATERRSVRPDPATDRLGWENGHWHDDPLAVNNTDGLNESELSAVVNRSMARVEHVRGLEFDGSVPVETVSRSAYRANNTNGSYGDSLRTFDNAKFEALFLVGEDRSSIEAQESTLGDSVQGYYSPSADAIVIVTNSETPRIGERTLSHELVHALQDQRFGLDGNASTRDAVQGRNGLIEGDARTVDTLYTDRCGAEWTCVTEADSDSGGSGSAPHYGVFYLVYFPYSDGSTFVSDLRARGGWAAVNAAYDDVPDGAREVTTVGDYPEWEPRTVTIPATPGEEWTQVRPSADRDRPDYATVGPSAIAASMGYTMDDSYNRSASVVSLSQFYSFDGGQLDRTDPYNYDLPATRGWEGGRMQVYTNGSETGYVWRTTWSDDTAAARFASSWERVIQHWGGSRTADGNWVVESGSPFSDALAVHVDGDTVTVVNAPTEAELTELYDA